MDAASAVSVGYEYRLSPAPHNLVSTGSRVSYSAAASFALWGLLCHRARCPDSHQQGTSRGISAQTIARVPLDAM